MKSWRTVTMMAGLVALGGCSTLDDVNPFNWFRDTSNDPGADAANSANLEAGSEQPYPNLSSVPSMPTRGLTEAQRDALAKGLVADRQNAHYADDQQRAGNAAAVPAAQTPLPEDQNLQPIDLASIEREQQARAQQQAQQQAQQAQQAQQQAANSAHALPPRPAPQQMPLPPVPQAPRVTSVAPVAAGGGGHLSVGGGLAAPVTASRESTLKTPTPREEPQAETPTAPPPAANLPPVPPAQPVQPMVAGHAPPNTSSLSVGGTPVPPQTPVRAEPTPTVPALPAVPDVAPQAAPPVPDRRQSSQSVAEVRFAAGSSAVPAGAAAALKGVPAQLQAHNGIVRVVGHATVATGGADAAGQQLQAYQAALARANAVKQALVAEGVDPAKIQTEAAAGNGDKADVLVEY